jgi:hypothetical protein
MPKRRVRLVPDAVTQFKALNAAERSRLKAAIQAALGDDDASVQNNNRFVLRRVSQPSEFEFRDGNLITKNGKPCAALMPITDDTDLEVLALSQNKQFWKIIDAAIERGDKEGITELADLD